MSTFQILNNKDIDKQKWDSLLLSDPSAFPYSISWYLDIVSPNWKALIVEDYAYALALPFREKIGLAYVFPPEFTQQMGIFGRDRPSDSLVNEILEFVVSQFSYLEFNLNQENELKRSFKGLKKKWRKNFELDLHFDYPELLSHFHKNTRRNIKKTETETLFLEEVSSPEKIISTFQEHKAKELKNASISYDLLESIIKEGINHNAIELYNIKKEEEYLGGAVFLTVGQRKVFLFSAINTLGRKHRAMFFLIDAIIKKNANKNLILDFEGSDNPKLASFYQRFGAKEKLYLHLKVNRLPFFIKWLKN